VTSLVLRREVKVVPQILETLRPNAFIESTFRAGYRAGVCKERGYPMPRDLHEHQAASTYLRKLVAQAFSGTAHPERLGLLFLGLHVRSLVVDDDAFLLMVKPVLDGLCSAWGWSKDRRKVARITGTVVREAPWTGLAVEVSP
jgi:hypothetical protein